MATKYMDNNGLLYFWQKIKNKFAEKKDIVTYSPATSESDGLMTKEMVTKLAGIDDGANKTVVDSFLSTSSNNPVQNKVLNLELGKKAPLSSPGFTGTPTAPTAPSGTNDTQIATTAFVVGAIASAEVGSSAFQGMISSAVTLAELEDYKKGWYWIVDTVGVYAGNTCEAGDFIYCISDRASAYSDDDFAVVQANLDIAAITNAEIDTIVSS